MSTKYRPAPEVQAIAEKLIEQHHRRLLGYRIEYLFRDRASSTHGRDVLGTARVIKGLPAFLARSDTLTITSETGEITGRLDLDLGRPVEPAPFFVIEIALDIWGGEDEDGERWGLSDAQRVALVDHELCHCDIGEDRKLVMRPHSIEEFTEIVQRHGLWAPDVRRFAEAAAKGLRSLPFGDAARPEGDTD